MAGTEHPPHALLRAMQYWNRRIQRALEAGLSLTDPQVVAWSQALDRCIVAWYHADQGITNPVGEPAEKASHHPPR